MKSNRKQRNKNIITIKRSNKVVQALDLPVICNLNPCSVYNKIDEVQEREHLTLDQIIKIEDHVVISNVSQRKEKGGRPAIIVNNKKYQVQNVTNTVVQIPWGGVF